MSSLTIAIKRSNSDYKMKKSQYSRGRAYSIKKQHRSVHGIRYVKYNNLRDFDIDELIESLNKSRDALRAMSPRRAKIIATMRLKKAGLIGNTGKQLHLHHEDR